MFAKEEGVPVEGAALGARIAEAVAGIVRRQADAGIDIVNDGEMTQAELRHLHQGPARRVRRRRATR